MFACYKNVILNDFIAWEVILVFVRSWGTTSKKSRTAVMYVISRTHVYQPSLFTMRAVREDVRRNTFFGFFLR